MRSFFSIIFVFSIFSVSYAQSIVEFDYEIDAYYSNVSAFIDLDSENEITDASNFSEANIYTRLLLNSLSPNIFLVEAAVHPMALTGLYIRDVNEDFYNKTNLQNVNMIQAVTAGFEEPYSFSFFVGRMMVFKNKGRDRIGKNRAYIGYLITFGNKSIKDNMNHEDKWINLEFKLKGTREQENRDLDWSFRIGTVLHGNNNFANNIYVAARRSSIDYLMSDWSIIYNSAFSTMIAVSAKTYNLTEAEIILEKKWPLKWTKKTSFGLGIGYLYNSGEKYSGALRDEGVENHQLIFRPNFKF